jgi:large subunit ribosomal protein L4
MAIPKKTKRTVGTERVRGAVRTEGRASAKHISIRVVGADGKAAGSINVPKTLFGTPAPLRLLAQSVRVYRANQRQGTASTKTRGEVEGSTRKIYRQKGTGRARHGPIRSPIFVGGGIVFGPKPRDYRMKLPKNMKRRALAGALTAKLASGEVTVVDGLEKLEAKTRVFAQTFSKLGAGPSTLVVVAIGADTVKRAARNIAGIDILPGHSVNAYEILAHAKVIIMKSALSDIASTFA